MQYTFFVRFEPHFEPRGAGQIVFARICFEAECICAFWFQNPKMMSVKSKFETKTVIL